MVRDIMMLTLEIISIIYKYLPLASLLALIFLLVYFLWNFPWILKYYKTRTYETDLTENNKIVVISDIHLKQNEEIPPEIPEIVSYYNADILIIAGDLFEYDHRKITEEKLKEILENLLRPLLRHTNVHEIYYITSTSSHDPKISDIITYITNGRKIKVIGGTLKIKYSDNIIYITHGDYACRNGGIATFLNIIMKKIAKKNMFIEKILRKNLKIPEDNWLICGHTHLCDIDEKSKIANTGAWKKKATIKPSKTAILIKNKKISIIDIKNKKIEEIKTLNL